jgi:hypothetical protein
VEKKVYSNFLSCRLMSGASKHIVHACISVEARKDMHYMSCSSTKVKSLSDQRFAFVHDQ